ncbi:hypothetical protein VTK26DRAFT_1558 [Humicola hyalothermophila]
MQIISTTMRAVFTVLPAILIMIIAAGEGQQFGGAGGGYYGPYGSGIGGGSSGPNSDSSSSSSSSGPNFSGFQGSGGNGGGPPFDIDEATRVRAVHGMLAAAAMVALFPGGAVLMRVLPGRLALWAHALAQMVALCVLVAGVAMGIRLVRIVRLPFVEGGSILSDPDMNYHPIIGLVVAACLLLQPVLGFIHHAKFKQVRRRQVWSYLHLFNGRIFITLGIVNGALGLWQARASGKLKSAYIGAAVAMWAVWMLVALWGECRRWVASRGGMRRRKVSDGDVSF